MNRLLVRRCSMSSIEEEDEPSTSDEITIRPEKISFEHGPQLHHSPSIADWDSELSESEQEFDDNDDDPNENGEERAANRALQNFMQTSSKTRQAPINLKDGSDSPSSIHLYDEDDSAELDAIISELRDFKIQFEECSNPPSSIKKSNQKMEQSTNHPSSSPTATTPSPLISHTNGCVYELRTLEDQLEAALASLTLTINDCTTTNLDPQQQRSSGSSACSSGLGEDIANDSINLYTNMSHTNLQTATTTTTTTTTVSFTSKIPTTNTTDDCDSAFSDSGSTDKVTSPNHDESVTSRSILTITNSTKQSTSMFVDQDESISSQHPSKLLVRTYNDDGSTKSILIDDAMTIRDVLFVLVHKNHREPDIDYALMEILPDLHMERTFEDHQKLSEAILMWPTTSPNRLIFTKRSEKYALFRATTSLLGKDETMLVYDQLLKTPDIDGIIYLKEKSRKSWKKHFCVLRSSGLYFVPKGKSKKDLVCLAKFENVELFFGMGWKKKFKSPSDYCFALKHPLIQKKSSKYIKYMCVDTKNEFDRWITSIRIAKFGQQLKINHLLMEKAMNIYRSSGRFAAVCAARSDTPNGQQSNSTNGELHPPPTPCPSIRDRQVLNRTPISIASNNNSSNQYYSMNSPRSPQPSSCHSIISTSTLIHDEHGEDDNDENSPIKSASYMDELRQRLERVLNDPPSPAPSQQSSLSNERQSCLPISKSFRLPVQPIPAQVQSSAGYRSTPASRVPMKSTSSSLQSQTNHLIPPIIKGTIRGPTLITPPKLKSTTNPQCLSSTENLRTTNHQLPPPPAITVGSTPLPRKQLPSFQVIDRNLSYRTTNSTNPYGHQYQFSNGNNHQQMSKSFIMPSKREDQRSASSLSVASKSDSLNLDDADFPVPSPTFLGGLSDISHNNTQKIPSNINKTKPTVINNMNIHRSRLPPTTNSTPLKKPSTIFRTNGRPQPPIPIKSGLIPPSLKLSNSISQARSLNKSMIASTSTNSLTNGKTSTPVNKSVPPVPPRKSSIPRPSFNASSPSMKPLPPQRDLSTIAHLPKPHVSHL